MLAGLDPDPSEEAPEERGGLRLRPLLRGDARDPAEVREGREGRVQVAVDPVEYVVEVHGDTRPREADVAAGFWIRFWSALRQEASRRM